ncbi:MAG TPA: Rrf2 family transcriptional regulator [Thermoanaerobaculia bacterium]|jgi:Rrf2 family protein|nr:Rrf2 family transcriptional regulator [Thermoanaerobaculia bacterium]
MRTTAASEYGCLALLAIAERGEGWCKRQEIIDRFGVPGAFLEQILRKLTAGGFVVSRRGAEGGFRLARPAAEVVIADVMRAMDGPLAPSRSVSENFYQPSPLEASPAYHQLFRKVRDAIAAILEQTTLEDILDAEREHHRHPQRRRRRAVPRPAAGRG